MFKPLPILSQMPWNVNQLIVSSADTVTKQTLRLCSKNFKNLVQSSVICYKQLVLDFDTNERTATVTLERDSCEDGPTLVYTSTRTGYTVKNLKTNEKKTLKNRRLIPAVIEQFMKIFRNPKTFVKCFRVTFGGQLYCPGDWFEDTKREVLGGIRQFFMSLNRRVAIEKFIFNFNAVQEDVLQLLPFFEPGLLQTIQFSSISSFGQPFRLGEVDLSRIAETEQWKQAKNLLMQNFKMSLPYEKWSNFTQSFFFRSAWTRDESVALFENFFKDPSFKSCRIYFESSDPKFFLEYYLKFGPEITGKPRKGITLKIDIPSQPDMWFIVKITLNSVFLSKVRKGTMEGMLEESVTLTAAQALADIDKYITSPR